MPEHSSTASSNEVMSAHRSGPVILELAVPCPLYKTFDYRLPAHLATQPLLPGMRIRVRFGRQHLIAVLLRQKQTSDLPVTKLRDIEAVLDDENLLGEEILHLVNWAARYYCHPPGDACATALPAALRNHDQVNAEHIDVWQIAPGSNSAQQAGDEVLLNRAPAQRKLHTLLQAHPDGLEAEQLNSLLDNWRSPMKALVEKGLVQCSARPAVLCAHDETQRLTLNSEQQLAADGIEQTSGHGVHVIEGVTGSGKTEVYIELCQNVIAQGRQALILVPEIGLTPQITQRFLHSLDARIVILHSAMTDRQRYAAWSAARTGQADLVIGTRSSIFTPLPAAGIIIVDEEHDPSFKQQDGFRYNARDLAIVRASRLNIPVVLGSATPSLETLNNVREQRYQVHRLRQRANQRPLPAIRLLNICNQTLHDGIADGLISLIKQHLENGQVLLFINRRGYAPLLMCHDCGWTTRCHRCDAHMTYHRKQHQLHCHHCGSQRRAPDHCEACNSSNVLAIGAGTERVEAFLQGRFPEHDVIRIDRDSTRRKGSLEAKLGQAREGQSNGKHNILVGTQMLAKGHDFPNITLVAILDTDQSLFSADFRAAENLAQLVIQVAGRAGRADKAGEVVIQTHHPEHPLLQTLIHHGYPAFAESALLERQQAKMPPAYHLAIVRCESVDVASAVQFLEQCRELAQGVIDSISSLEVYGPVPAPMEKRAGRYRQQMILLAPTRKPLHQLLDWWIPQLAGLPAARKVRWSIDVDPYDSY
jgi:primosomal protein N' (replication factor Y)